MNLQQSSDFEMTASAGEAFRRFHSLESGIKQMQFDDKFTVQIFRFKHIVTGIEHEPSKEEVLEQT